MAEAGVARMPVHVTCVVRLRAFGANRHYQLVLQDSSVTRIEWFVARWK